MATVEIPHDSENVEKPFKDMQIYISCAVKGEHHPDPNFVKDFINYIKEKGGTVSSEHIGEDDFDKMASAFIKNTGVGMETEENSIHAGRVRQANLSLVREAKYFISLHTLSDGDSTLIHEAISKHKMGLNLTPVLCLCQVDKWEKLSNMIKGIGPIDSPVAFVKTYKDIEDAKKIAAEFLTSEEIINIVQIWKQ